MRTLIAFLIMCSFSFGQSIVKDGEVGEVMETLPQDFFKNWDVDEEETPSFFYRVESSDDVHRIFEGEFETSDEPLPKLIYRNPEDKNEMAWFVPIKKHKDSVVLVVYFHKVPDEIKFDLVRMYIAWEKEEEMILIPPQIFPNPEVTIDDFAIYMINNIGTWLTVTKGQIQ